jgi:AcrR family transcriptional regulator
MHHVRVTLEAPTYVPRRGLDRSAVVEAAAEIADSEGLEFLTLARLAEHVGVRAPSLYNHVIGMDGLRRELALFGSRTLVSVLGRATVGKAGGEAVLALADAYRAFARARPGLYAATVRAPAADDPELQQAGQEVVEIVLAVLGAYDLRGDSLLHAARAVRAIVHGFVSMEAAGGFGFAVDPDESFHRLIRAFVRGELEWKSGRPGPSR